MTRFVIAGLVRVTKQAARRIYNAGGIIFLCPVNLRPGAPWNPECAAQISEEGRTFDSVVNAFSAYNCTTSEAGRYPAFYVREGGAQV